MHKIVCKTLNDKNEKFGTADNNIQQKPFGALYSMSYPKRNF